MLTKCPECDLQVSSKAITCPHCGFPLKGENIQRRQKSNRRKRLPNGFGQISQIKNQNLSKPFRVMVNDGIDQKTGKYKSKLLKPVSYFKTYNEAYAALVEYHKNPFDISKDITVKELYAKWIAEYAKTFTSDQSKWNYERAWKFCYPVYNMKISEIRPRHIKGCIYETEISDGKETRKPSAAIQVMIKALFNLMYDYAMEYELVTQNYARSFKLPKNIVHEKTQSKTEHITYSDKEMQSLWENISIPGAAEIIVQCYSGWRPSELCEMKISDVDLKNMTFKSGMKTEAGKNRIVPIHPKIQDLVRSKYQKASEIGSEYLFTDNGKPLSYNRLNYLLRLLKTEISLDSDHRLHDGRKHFVTLAKKYGVDEYAIKYIVGHVIKDITESVYTKRELPWLRSEIEKIR